MHENNDRVTTRYVGVVLELMEGEVDPNWTMSLSDKHLTTKREN